MFDSTAASKLLENGRKFPATLYFHEKRVGGLSKPSKMPWYGWSISAYRCKTGSKLRKIENSVCSKCYATSGRYAFGTVQNALERRLECYDSDPAAWAASMVLLLEGKAKGQPKEFRWFDSGDVQSKEMAQAIIWVAQQTPHIKHWVPTKEPGTWMEDGVHELVASTPNLTVRVSAPMIGKRNSNKYFPTSSVGATGPFPLLDHKCPSKQQDNKCGDCRACWDRNIRNVDYQTQ